MKRFVSIKTELISLTYTVNPVLLMYLCLTLIYSQTSCRLIVYSLFIEVVSADQTFEWIINGYLDHAVIKQ